MLRLAGRHHVQIAVPMLLAEALRNDDIKGLPDRFLGREAKNTLRARIPKANGAVAVGIDYGVWNFTDDGLTELHDLIFDQERIG